MTERDVKYKILVVDDEADVRSLLKDYFELNNYLVLTAQNGEEALEKAAQNPTLSFWISICLTGTVFPCAGGSAITFPVRFCF